jgi:hypothetical protein
MSSPRLRRRHVLVFFYALTLGLLLLPAQDKKAASEKLTKGPVIQNVQTDRATITWVTGKPAGAIHKAGSDDAVNVSESEYHELELTGLEAGTSYVWSLNEGGIAAKASFTTAPAKDVPFTFVVFGDTRTRHEVHRKAEERIVAEKGSFVLHTGDLVSDGLKSEDWDKFFDIEKELLSNIPFYPTPGNHERNALVYFRYFSFPGGNGHRYSFNWGSVHIAAVDTNEIGDSPQARAAFLDEEVEWLRQDLTRNKRPITFVFMHHPLYTAVESRRAHAADMAAKLEPVLVAGGVTAVFAGHDHNYQHHLKSGIHFIVTGGGGAPLYDVSPIPDITLKALKIENYVRVRIEGGLAKIEAFDLEGETIDAFDLSGRK